MALFRKKPPPNEVEAEGQADSFTPQPEKARKWFEHAKTAALSSNYDYALQCFAFGIRLDPTAMSAHVSMLESAVRYMGQGARPASGKEIRSIDDGSTVGKFAAAEFEWMKDLKNPKCAIKALEAAVTAELREVGNWIAPNVWNLVRGQKKLSKSLLLQAMEMFREVGAWDASMAAGQMAYQIDPSDAELDAELKNLSAQRAMDQGGYDSAAGAEGGFRKFIKDADKQQELLEEGTLAAGASVEERNLLRAKQAYEATPNVPDVINRYAQLLKKEGTPEMVGQARAIYEKGFADTGEYRFRMYVGDIDIEQLEQQIRALDEELAADPDDGVQAERDRLRHEVLELKSNEYTARVAKYPTDRARKYELGVVQLTLGQYGDAMAHFQAAKDEPKYRVRAGHMLGRCFLAEEWFTEAVSEFEEAIEAIDATERERELAVRYDLMLALIAAARQDDSIDFAKQAKSICSEIARKDITYRDIRVKRKEVDEIIKGLS